MRHCPAEEPELSMLYYPQAAILAAKVPLGRMVSSRVPQQMRVLVCE
jgi:hypothetical protein